VTTPKFPLPPPKGPEEVRALGSTGAYHFAGRSHDLGGFEVVDGHAVLAAEPAKTAAKCQSSDAGGGVDADRRSEAMGLGSGVEVRKRGTPFDGHAACVRVDARGLHLREVDHDAFVAHSIASNVVPTAADGEDEPIVPCKVYGKNDVRCRNAPSDERRVPIDCGVPDFTCAFVPLIAWKKNLSPETIFQLFELGRL
jgi:hypothetical protein